MPDRLPALDEPNHSDEWTYAYLEGELSEVEKAAFEEHLKAHADCREEVETMRAALPAFADVLAEDGWRHAKELLAEAEARRQRAARRPAWSWRGLGFAGLAGVAASLVFFVQAFSGLEPTLLRVPQLAPAAEPAKPPEMIAPELLDLATTVHFGRLALEAQRGPGDVYTAVGLIDSNGKRWLVQSGERLDSSCSPGCGPLELRVKLDALAPGPVRVGALMSDKPIRNEDLGRWLPDAGETVPQWVGARGFAAARVVR